MKKGVILYVYDVRIFDAGNNCDNFLFKPSVSYSVKTERQKLYAPMGNSVDSSFDYVRTGFCEYNEGNAF